MSENKNTEAERMFRDLGLFASANSTNQAYELAEKLAASYPFELDELRKMIYDGLFVYHLEPKYETYAAILNYSAAYAVDLAAAMNALHGPETEPLNLENWTRELEKNVLLQQAQYTVERERQIEQMKEYGAHWLPSSADANAHRVSAVTHHRPKTNIDRFKGESRARIDREWALLGSLANDEFLAVVHAGRRSFLHRTGLLPNFLVFEKTIQREIEAKLVQTNGFNPMKPTIFGTPIAFVDSLPFPCPFGVWSYSVEFENFV